MHATFENHFCDLYFMENAPNLSQGKMAMGIGSEISKRETYLYILCTTLAA
tara:strand:+ start:1125 stop:1277 length:153 start_codon:yes stop_codon:yes gene_type:complete